MVDSQVELDHKGQKEKEEKQAHLDPLDQVVQQVLQEHLVKEEALESVEKLEQLEKLVIRATLVQQELLDRTVSEVKEVPLEWLAPLVPLVHLEELDLLDPLESEETLVLLEVQEEQAVLGELVIAGQPVQLVRQVSLEQLVPLDNQDLKEQEDQMDSKE